MVAVTHFTLFASSMYCTISSTKNYLFHLYYIIFTCNYFTYFPLYIISFHLFHFTYVTSDRAVSLHFYPALFLVFFPNLIIYWTKVYHCMLYRENLNARILCTCSKPVISKVCLYMIYLHDSVSYFCTDFERRKETGTYAYSVRLYFIGALIRFLVFYYVHLVNSFGFSMAF